MLTIYSFDTLRVPILMPEKLAKFGVIESTSFSGGGMSAPKTPIGAGAKGAGAGAGAAAAAVASQPPAGDASSECAAFADKASAIAETREMFFIIAPFNGSMCVDPRPLRCKSIAETTGAHALA
ncbi:hypothetical protein MSC49_28740 [Methylosinus sp. C49]|nr:hypothetical protein MSC49_28740 [Methylosinus sp. C49]